MLIRFCAPAFLIRVFSGRFRQSARQETDNLHRSGEWNRGGDGEIGRLCREEHSAARLRCSERADGAKHCPQGAQQGTNYLLGRTANQRAAKRPLSCTYFFLLPSVVKFWSSQFHTEKSTLTRKVRQKEAMLRELLLQHVAFKRLIERNRKTEAKDGKPK